MNPYSLFASLLVLLAIVFLFGLTPETITTDILKIISPKLTLRNRVRTIQGKIKSKKISVELKQIQDALVATGKGNQFASVCAASLSLLIFGGIFAIIISNWFLIPILGIIVLEQADFRHGKYPERLLSVTVVNPVGIAGPGVFEGAH